MASITKDEAKQYYIPLIKAIQEKEKSPKSPAGEIRLKELRSFKDAIESYLGKEVPSTASMGNYKFVKPLADTVDLTKISLPGLQIETEKITEPTPKAADTTPKPTAPQAPSPTPTARSSSPLTPGTRTLARPGGIERVEIDVPLKDLQDYRRRLQGEQSRRINEIENTKDSTKLNRVRKDLDRYENVLNRTIALERQVYDENPNKKPADWDVAGPKSIPMSEGLKRDRVTIEQLPEALKSTVVGRELFGREPGTIKKGELPPEKISKKFVNNEIRRITNDIIKNRKELENFNPKVAKDRPEIKKREDLIDKAKDELRYFHQLRPVGVENSRLTNEYKRLATEMTDMLTPAQREAFKAGQEIDIKKIPNSRRFLESLRELGRERDRVFQGINDEMRYVNASPGNTIEKFRAMDPEERQDILSEVKEREFMQNVLQGAPSFYEKQVGQEAAGKAPFDSLAPAAQQDWIKKYAAQEARTGAPGMAGSDIYKWLFGGGQEFISKHPPELYRPLIRSAKEGLRGIGQTTRTLQQQLQQDPFEQIFGAQAAPNLRQLFLGVGPDQQQTQGQPQQPQQQVAPQPPPPYEFPLQKQPSLPNLRQMLANEL